MAQEKAVADDSKAVVFDRWHSGVPKHVRWPTLIGVAIGLAFFGGIGVWAGTAEVSGAVATAGVFRAKGQNKIVQHLEGGIIHRILIEEGQTVKVGQVLIKLDDTGTKAQLQRLVLRRYQLMAILARLDAERDLRTEITFPPELAQGAKIPEIAPVIKTQYSEFKARSHQLTTQIAVLERRIAAIEEERAGLVAQREAVVSQLALIKQELEAQESLLEKGLTRLTTVLALKRESARLEGQRGELSAAIGRSKERATEQESEIIHLKAKRVEEATEALRTTETEIADLEQRITAARDQLQRTSIRAPVNGVVVKLAQHTTGGVLKPGDAIVELLPIEEDLIVEAYVRPQDIDSVKKGNRAELRLTSLNQVTTPSFKGHVVYVSADTVESNKPGEKFYIARVRIDDSEADKLSRLELAPGMPVEVFIETNMRTVLQYFAKPLKDRLSHAFREP